MASHTHFAPALARSVDALGGVDVGYYEATWIARNAIT